jgi:phage terminase large subunit
MDFGFSHIFAVVTIAVWGQNAFVIDAIGQAGLELEDKVAICQHLKALEPTIYGDPESPESIATFKRRGFKMATWSKGQGSVNAGIEVVRTKIWNLERGASLFFLEGDPSVAAAFKEMAEYCFKTDAAGNFSNVPEDEGDDHADACRYVIMNVFARQGALKAEASVPDAAPPQADPMAAIRAQQQNWLSDHVRMLTGEAGPSDEPSGQVVKKGGFIWDPG